MRFFLIVLFHFCFSILTFSTNYYFSANGNDSNSGKTKNRPLKSIKKLNSLSLNNGDSILFNRGDSFSGEIVIRHSGTIKKPIVYAAYGEGKSPIITGIVQLTPNITKIDGLSTFPVTQKILKLYVDGNCQTLARYPNFGFLKTNEGVKNLGFETGLNFPTGYLNNITVRIRTIDWSYEERNVKYFENGQITFDTPTIYDISKGYGYFLENKREFIDSEGEWYSNDSELSLQTKLSVKNTVVEGVIHNNGIVIAPNSRNIHIKSLKIEKFNKNGIFVHKQSQNITIENNNIAHVGYMGIWLDTLVSNTIVKHNKVERALGRGITGVRLTNCIIESNTVKHIGLSPGEGISGINGMVGIVIENYEHDIHMSYSNNNRIAYNTVDSTGYAGIRMDGTNSICEFNIVKNTNLKLNDSGAIYCYGKFKGQTDNNIIRNNLIINSVGCAEATPGNHIAANGIYIDNNSTRIAVEHNTVINATNSGLFVNDGAPTNYFRNNTVYNSGIGIGFAEWANKKGLYGCETTNNTIVCVKPSQRCISILTFIGDDLKPGFFANNIYINQADKHEISKNTNPESGWRINKLFTLQKWQKTSGEELGSVTMQRNNAGIIYNDSFIPTKVNIPDGIFEDIYGNKLDKSVLLNPCASQIIVPVE